MTDPLVLGIHYGHDSGAAIVSGVKIIAAVNEERFSRIKHHAAVPINSIIYCLEMAKANINDLDAIAIASISKFPNYTPFINFEKQIKKKKNTNNYYSKGVKTKKSVKVQIYEEFHKISKKISEILHPSKSKSIKRNLPKTPPSYFNIIEVDSKIPVYLIHHHLAHAASAYYTSGFGSDNLIITVDGVGEKISTAVWQAVSGSINLLLKIEKEGSLGWFYGIITEALGWVIGNGEGKTMGLAAYGNPNLVKNKLKTILPIYKNGQLFRGYNYSNPTSWSVKETHHWHFQESEFIQNLLNQYKREDIAAAGQALLEEEIMKLISYWVKKLDIRYLCVAGGVFLNVKLNQFLLNNLDLDNYFIFPNPGDGGLALGAALHISSKLNNNTQFTRIKNIDLGPSFSNDEIESILKLRKLKYEKSGEIPEICGEKLAQGKIIGWFQGRMEYGPRALGNRSILIDPRNIKNKEIINRYVKFREEWRPFCPTILEEHTSDYFINPRKSPYMIISFDVIPDKINEIPAVVHVDGTTRPQTISKKNNSYFYRCIKRFADQTSIPLILNTSFNIRGEPIICSPIDAINCFFNTGMDILVLNDFIIEK